jgi:type VI secretion system secreted protein VgrG
MATVKHVRASLESASFDCSAMQVYEVHGREAISEPFFFDVRFLVPGEHAFRAKTALGKSVKLVFSRDGAPVRHVHGIVAEAVDSDPTEEHTRHRLRIVPRLHRLTLSVGCEVFLGKSVLQIAVEKLARVGVVGDDVRSKVVDPPAASEFRLQYAESDLAFVSRHLEHAGIAYSFDHTGETDVLVFSDSNAAFPHASGPESLPYVTGAEPWGITSLETRSAMVAATHVVNDYLPSHPKLDLCGEEGLGVPFGGEIVDYGTGHRTAREGKALARSRALSRQALAEGFDGESNVPQVEAARTFAVEGQPGAAMSRAPAALKTQPGSSRMLVVWVEHHLRQVTDGRFQPDALLDYRNRFRAIDATRPYRPALGTPSPRIAGFVTAVTTAPKSVEESVTPNLDDQGRYLVRFLFDRADDTARPASSARVRMMQPHAGAGYGMHFPLKPGIEVAVVFQEGDPDRPLIAGAVPNALTQSPVMDRNATTNHLQTESGIRIRMRDR